MNPPTCLLSDPYSKRFIVRFGWPLLLACGILLIGLPVHAESTKISGSLPMDGDVSPGFRISPNGNSVLYIADQAADGVDELFRVPVDGGTPVKVSGDLVAGGAVASFQISQGGNVILVNPVETDGAFRRIQQDHGQIREQSLLPYQLRELFRVYLCQSRLVGYVVL